MHAGNDCYSLYIDWDDHSDRYAARSIVRIRPSELCRAGRIEDQSVQLWHLARECAQADREQVRVAVQSQGVTDSEVARLRGIP